MNILGLNMEEFCSAAIMKDGQVIAACAEERFTREKNYSGFPKHSIEYCLRAAGLTVADIDHVAVVNLGVSLIGFYTSYVQRRARFTMDDYIREANDYWYPRLYEGKEVDFLDVFKDKICLDTFPEEFNEFFFNEINDYQLGDIEKVQKIKKRLIQAFYPEISQDKITCYPHHQIHAFYGYFGSSFGQKQEDALVVTADSWGDYENGMISKFEDGKFDILHTINNQNLGRLFRNLTLLLGMKPYDHEYKVMGLAPYAPDYLAQQAYDIFSKTMDVEGLNFVDVEKPKDNYFWFIDRLEGIRFDGIAAGLQRYFEDRLQKWVTNAVKEYQIKKITFSGGLAMNIKANMKLTESDEIKDFFVAASPDDNSNCIGICHLAQYRHLEKNGGDLKSIKPLNHVYLGPAIEENDIQTAIVQHRLKDSCSITEEANAEFVAQKLIEGKVIGRCSGRMEFGARSLGNRSILADPRNLHVVQRINRIIKKRDFWMPFAPVVIDRYWDKYLENPKNLYSPYMTVGFKATKQGQKDMPAGIHMADQTTRPQMLVREMNPEYYDIIDAFEKKTGVGALLNTSFNLHGYPIVCTVADAMEVLENSDLDALLLNDTYVEKKRSEVGGKEVSECVPVGTLG